MKRIRKAPEERRKELMDISLRLFTEKGYEATQVQHICTEAEVAKGTFFYHFPTKEAVLEEIFSEWGRSFAESYAERTKNLSAIAKLRAFLDLFGEDSPMDCLMDQLTEENQDQLIQRLWKLKIQPAFEQMLIDMVTQGIAEGTMQADNLRLRIDFFWGILDTLWDVQQKNYMTDEAFAQRQEIAYEQLRQLWGIEKGIL